MGKVPLRIVVEGALQYPCRRREDKYPPLMSTPPSVSAADPRLLQLVDELEAMTRRPSIEISSELAPELPVTSSKFGGTPYLPVGESAPQGSYGPLALLAQIRLADLPANSFLPDAGLPQFWIGRDDVYGVEYGALRTGDFKVVHYPTIDEAVSEEDVVARYSPPGTHNEDELSPFETSVAQALTFRMTSQPLSVDDNSFGEVFSGLWNRAFPEAPVVDWWELPNDVADFVGDRFRGSGHRLGGYPFFTQSDPRGTDDLEQETVLLLQVDSDRNIIWGDAGVGGFFILPQELAAGDFSRVAYTWDCL